jgi:hypothetical protein
MKVSTIHRDAKSVKIACPLPEEIARKKPEENSGVRVFLYGV